VIFGGLFALALLFLIRGEVSIIAVGISSIMFGIAINYPLHFIQHFNHVKDVKTVIKDLREPLITGNITTVAAFISLIFTGSDAMIDLGLFAALLLLGTILFVLFFLPHFLTNKTNVERKSFIDKYIEKPFEQNKKLLWAVVALTVFFAFFRGDSLFEMDMQKINYMTDSQKNAFQKMMGVLNDNKHVIYYISEGKTLDEALEINEAAMPALDMLLKAGDVSKIAGVGRFFPSQSLQNQKVARWNTFWETHRDSVTRYLREAAQQSGFRDGAFERFETMIARRYETVDLSYFNSIKTTLAQNYIVDADDNYMIINILYTDRAKAQLLEEKLNSLNTNSLSFDSGSITRRMVASLSNNFNYVLYVCGFVVFAFLLLSFGRIELVLIAFTPLILSWIWIIGLMNIFDIRFNIVNIILATFIFGQGDDYTIFMTEGMMYEYKYGRKILASYKKSILLSALIMFIGMGMLIFAKHPALRSLGEVTVIGMLTVIVTSFVIPTYLFRLLTVKKGRKRLMPVTFKNLLSLIYSFFIFLIMSFITTICGYVLFAFGRKTEDKKTAYHRLLHRVANFVIYRIPQVKTVFKNISGETFDNPGVIICNHQSHIDLMCVMMLTPKLIILTNDWVWNSPFYGKLIKYADYYPVSDGIEKAIPQLKDAVDRGYSIVVFPEGTRSEDCAIQRFHRGAFYLAETLQLDIIPVLIHGVGHVLPKNEFMLRRGRIDIRVLPRITPGDARFRQDYSHRSIDVRHYYIMEYEKLCQETETPDYYADLVKHNYIYKGADIEREVNANLWKNKNFTAEIITQNAENKKVIKNSGYGEFPLLLSLVKKNLQISVIEEDTDIKSLAENCASVPGNLKYDATAQP
jgi:1-acyl-sn-glycerol-3-phosphate acyltransferase